MGVGEEEWGSGEREVLEDYIRKTNGLVEVMVSRYGEASPLQLHSKSNAKGSEDISSQEPWMGNGSPLKSTDGVIFSGAGVLSRKSLRDISHWVDTIYRFGDHAYGVRDNPTSDRRKRRRKNQDSEVARLGSPETLRPGRAGAKSDEQFQPRIPPPIVTAVESSLDKASKAVETEQNEGNPEVQPFMASLSDTETWMKYLTLGYGTAWGGKGSETPSEQPPTDKSDVRRNRAPSPEVAMRYIEPEPAVDRAEEKARVQIQSENDGYFIIGLKGDMQNEDVDDDNEDSQWNNRTMLRTLHVEVLEGKVPETPSSEVEAFDLEREVKPEKPSKYTLTRLRPVIYVVSKEQGVWECHTEENAAPAIHLLIPLQAAYG
jgi:hypothetical protein